MRKRATRQHQAITESARWAPQVSLGNEILGTARLAEILGYASAAAVRQAGRTGRLGLNLFEIAGRRGLYAFKRDVVTLLNSIDSSRLARQSVGQDLCRNSASTPASIKTQHREGESSQSDSS